MTPERLAQIEDGLARNMFNSEAAPDVVEELAAALREAQQNQLDTERTYVQLRDFHDTQMQAARAECDTLAATLERVREITNLAPEYYNMIVDALDGEQHDQPDPQFPN